MARRSLISLLFCLLLIPAGSVAWSDDVTVATLEWEPYVGSVLPGNGYVGRVVREAFARSGHEVRFLFLPWERVLDMARHGEVAAYGPEYYDPSLNSRFVLSDPIPGGSLGFFAPADSAIRFRSLRDLEPYSIAVVRGYLNTPEFDSARYLHRQFVTSDALGLHMLVNGRVDLVLADKYVGKRLLRELFPERRDEVVFLDPPLAEKSLHLCFPRSRPDHRELLRAFNAGLRSMVEDHTLDGYRATLGK
ncbi:MAG: substrate-binding periplasmic protein [Desulfovibrio sp.]